MEDPTGGEGGSGAGPSQRRGHIDLTLPPGSGDELSDLVAKLDQVERGISRLSESRVESTRGLEARQDELARLKMVLSEVDERVEQARSMDLARDQERARQQADLYTQMEPLLQAEAQLAARRQALGESMIALQLQLWKAASVDECNSGRHSDLIKSKVFYSRYQLGDKKAGIDSESELATQTTVVAWGVHRYPPLRFQNPIRDRFTPRGAYTSRLSKFCSKTSSENLYREGFPAAQQFFHTNLAARRCYWHNNRYTIVDIEVPNDSVDKSSWESSPLVLRIFTENSISPGPCRRQRGSRYTIRAGRYLCDKEFCYLRTVRVTAAVYRGFHSKLITLLLPTFQHRAGVRLYTSCYHLAESCVSNKQSLPPGMCRFPNQKIGEHPFSRSYGVILPSSFDMVLSSALVYSTCSPVSVWGTVSSPGGSPPNSKFFPGSLNLVDYDNSRDYKQTRDYGRAVTTSGMASSHSVTGGMYKARERIHRRMADRRLLAILASCRRHVCRPGHKGHDDLTSSSPSSGLSPAVCSGHAPPVSAFLKARLSFKRIRGMSSPGGILHALATALHESIRTAPSIHRLRLRLLGYLIPFAPLAFVSQCQCRPSRVLSPLVFFPISTHFTAPPEIPSAPTPPTDALRPIIPDNACILCLTAAAGTELADAYSPDTVITSSPGKEESGPCLSPSVADHPLGPATDHRLGKQLPHQLANQTRAPPRADSSFCSSAYVLFMIF
ncbi:hypothetical protein RJT34_22710 [Clitoria ternatea]|uniref:Uncharacterized protein n=1 Tax=Clitoria ternatea TaxID=43366 RepID=A0AAN9FQP4_CLITE